MALTVNFEGMKKRLESSLDKVEDTVQKAYGNNNYFDINNLNNSEIEILAIEFLKLNLLLRTFSILEESKNDK
jgi:hypothetical protein